MFYRAVRLSAFIAALGVTALASGQAMQSPVRITLDQAVQLALSHNHALQAARTTIAQAKDAEVTANLRPNPTLGVDYIGLPLRPSQFNWDNITNTTEFDTGISYLFERGKKRQNRLANAKDQTAVTTSTVADNERTLTFNVATAFTNVLLAESTLDFANQDLKSFQNTIDISESQYKAGTLEYQKLPYNVEDLQAMALKNRPDLRAAEQGVTQAMSAYKLQRAIGKVDVTGTLNYTHIADQD